MWLVSKRLSSLSIFADLHRIRTNSTLCQVSTSRIDARMQRQQRPPCLLQQMDPTLVLPYPRPLSSPLNLNRLTGHNTPLPLRLLPSLLVQLSHIQMIHQSGVVQEEEYVMVQEEKIVVKGVRRSIIESCIYLGVRNLLHSSQVQRERGRKW